MKRLVHLYIFAILSTIASVRRIKSTFFTPFDEESYRTTLNRLEVAGSNDLVKIAKASADFSTNLINKVLTAALFILIMAMIFFLFKKANKKASYTYITYLFGTLIHSTYSFFGGAQATKPYETAMVQVSNTGEMVLYGINLVLFMIYLSITLFFLLKKPKGTPSTDQNTTNI